MMGVEYEVNNDKKTRKFLNDLEPEIILKNKRIKKDLNIKNEDKPDKDTL